MIPGARLSNYICCGQSVSGMSEVKEVPTSLFAVFFRLSVGVDSAIKYFGNVSILHISILSIQYLITSIHQGDDSSLSIHSPCHKLSEGCQSSVRRLDFGHFNSLLVLCIAER